MKLNKNERLTLKLILDDSSISNSDIGRELGITTQAVGKIKKKLKDKGIIKGWELVLDYEKLGLNLFAIALIKVMPIAFKKLELDEFDTLLNSVNVIESYAIPKTNVTHILMYAFKDIAEYDNYFKKLLTQLGDYIEIKNTYVFSSNSILKYSAKDLFISILQEYEKPKMHEPVIPKEKMFAPKGAYLKK
ncbi:Lrp/AsnC family transcriptional regulator [Candidatus Woesearchaeota archaeon]|nr:Lrp/AsnC family transcriptional regulator [Candidatus Woesearchaeota archaeon]